MLVPPVFTSSWRHLPSSTVRIPFFPPSALLLSKGESFLIKSTRVVEVRICLNSDFCWLMTSFRKGRIGGGRTRWRAQDKENIIFWLQRAWCPAFIHSVFCHPFIIGFLHLKDAGRSLRRLFRALAWFPSGPHYLGAKEIDRVGGPLLRHEKKPTVRALETSVFLQRRRRHFIWFYPQFQLACASTGGKANL